MTERSLVAAAIPAYEAGATVGDVVRRTSRILETVVVIDDGSSDGTSQTARAAGATVLSHPRNLGKGRALRTAFDHLFARGFEMVVTLDADGQHLPEQFPALIEMARGGASLVIGSRTHLYEQMHWVRRASNTWSSRAISRLAGQPLRDVQCGFRLYTRALIARTGFVEPRFEAESAVVIRAVRLGLEVAWVPVDLGFTDGRITSHYRPIIDSLRIAAASVRARIERHPPVAEPLST